MISFFFFFQAELRSLNRTNREESNRLVQEGGSRTKSKLFGLLTWQLTLLPTPAEVFGSDGPKFSVDGDPPVTLLLRRHDDR